MKKIVLCGGGTAGHVYPALAVAEKLNGYEIHYFGGDGIEKEILKNFPDIIYHQIPAVKFERKFTPKNLLIPFKLWKAVKETKRELQKVAPDGIFSKGGFVSVPVAMAGKKLNIPIISHESDLSFGLANKIVLKYCSHMCTTFDKTANGNKKCIHTGQPIRRKIFEGQKLRLNFDETKPTILVLGGSLGAKFLNEIIFENLEKLTEKYNIIHICGKKNAQEIVHQNYFLTPYAENIEDYYASADIVISRAGSGVINELLALEKPMLLIPLSKKCSRGDQIENAKLFVEKGYALMLEEENFNFIKLNENLEKLTKNKQNFIKNMKKTAKNNAVEQIFNLITKF
ncbi:MAG: undecaprenyldiphospho-muramoylpentapeptide beta-N-acetylglucosaminyltransferase [Clostridia bacterium]|nr:undecaprenyldiphospho-muramoylpentapeptide beta-N-acetylglucosaminyltransferase [Clostridia bacterium]